MSFADEMTKNLLKNEILALRIETTIPGARKIDLPAPFDDKPGTEGGALASIKPRITVTTPQGDVVVQPYGDPRESSLVPAPVKVGLAASAIGLGIWLLTKKGRK